MNEMMWAETPSGAAQRVQPYGPAGLIVSTFLMLVLTLAICALLAGALAGADFLLNGREQLVSRFNVIGEALATEDKGRLVGLASILGIFVYIAAVAAIGLVAWFRGRGEWRALLAWRSFTPGGLWWGLAAGAIFYGLVAGFVIVRLYPEAKGWVTLPSDPIGLGALFVLAVICAPVAEELLFRGWLFTGLRARYSTGLTIFVTALLFALAHFEHTGLYALAVFPTGLILGYARERFGSVVATIAMHSVYNGSALLAKLVLPD